MGAKEGIAIVFCHRGYQPHLIYALGQAARSNPDSEIYLLGDQGSAGLPFAKHLPLGDFAGRAAEFAAVYQHRSDNPPDFELFCFQRWFILEEFLRRERLPGALMIDSDVLLYCDMERERRHWEEFPLCLVQAPGGAPSGHACLINDPAGLARMCDFFLQLYGEPELFELVESQYRLCKERGVYGGACDMTAMKEYIALRAPKIGNLWMPADAGERLTFDENMNCGNGFEMSESEVKRIRFTGPLPYGRLLEDGTAVRFLGLHFQGAAKRLMGSYYHGRRLPVARRLALDLLGRLLLKLRR